MSISPSSASLSPKTLLVIAGPTAVGKTAISINLALQLHTSIISADSRQCYREMSIGTAKPSPSELAHVKHYFINDHSITEDLSAADYESIALTHLQEIFTTNNVAIACGGTGLYIKALCEGLDPMPPVNPAIEESTLKEYKSHGILWLQESLRTEDPDFFIRAELANPARLLRALTFKRSTGRSILEFRKGHRKIRPFRIIKTALDLPREELYNRINLRVDQMMSQGLLHELKNLYPHRHLKNLQTVGYAELFNYLDGNSSLEEAVEKIKQHTRNYAKRQLTWFRKDTEFTWFNAHNPHILEEIQALLPK